MRRWSDQRESEWGGFCRALGRMGRALAARKRDGGGYEKKREARHPLLNLVLTSPQIRDVIGTVVPGADKPKQKIDGKSIRSWASVGSAAGGAVTLRLNHTGTKESCAAALSAMIDALRRAGHRIIFHDLLRHEDQNGYSMVARVREPTLAPALGFAR